MSKHDQEPTLPEGYRKDAAGRLVPLGTIKPIDLDRDRLVVTIAEKAKELSGLLAEFKGSAFGDIEAFLDHSAKQYKYKARGAKGKGNLSLVSFDGRYKVQRAVAEYITFDERLQVAKGLIDQCIHDWSQGSRVEIQVLVNDAFQVDKEGNINVGRVLGLRKLAIADKRWKQAMEAIGDALKVVGSKAYVRVYERLGDANEYRAISLDLAAV
jgi:hypothetical protein